MAKAERDGTYTLDGIRFKKRAGGNLPDGAVMDQAKGENTTGSGQGEDPVWYGKLLQKAEAEGKSIPARLPDETKAAYEARVKALGPSENTTGSGPSEQS